MTALQAYKYLMKHPIHAIRDVNWTSGSPIYQITKSGNIQKISWNKENTPGKYGKWDIETEWPFNDFVKAFTNTNFVYCNVYYNFN